MNFSQNKFYSLFLSLLSGLIFCFSWNPWGIPFLLFFAFIPLFILENIYFQKQGAASRLKVFGYSFLAFLIWNVGTTWWIFNASSFGSFFAFIFNSMFMATVFLIFHKVHLKSGTRAYFIFPFLWISFEYLHLNWDLSWPWLTLGNAFAGFNKYIQWYEYTGVLGGSLWILLVNVLLFNILKSLVNTNKLQVSSTLLIISLPIIFSLLIYSKYEETKSSASVVIVQPNVDPYNEKFSGSAAEQIQKMLSLASTKIDSSTEYLVLPETAIPQEVYENEIEKDESILLLQNFISAHPHLKIISGMASYRVFENSETKTPASRDFNEGQGFYESYNSAFQLDVTGKVPIYHKSELVIGVEKIPFPKIFGFFEKITIDLGGASGSLGTQTTRDVFHSNNGNAAPVICYESIYGDFCRGYIHQGADFIAIITNDGWWGNTPGYKQHLLLGRLRAIEFRRDIARSANTGTSCFINQRGDISQPTEYWEPAVIKGSVNLNSEKTFYARFGDYLGWLSVFFFFSWIIFEFVKRKFQK